MVWTVETAVTAALIASALSLVSSAYVARAQRQLHREAREDERESKARNVLECYRGPLLSAASELGDRIDNIRHRRFIGAAESGSGLESQAKLTTLFRLAQFFGWREVLRTEVQLLRFENEADTQLVAALIGDVVWCCASDAVDDKRALLWSEEQRAIGELMVNPRDGASPRSIGYATFARTYDDVFSPWMDAIADEVLSARAPASERLRLMQWALYGLVIALDEERAYRGRPWIRRARKEIGAATPRSQSPRVETEILEHLAKVADR